MGSSREKFDEWMSEVDLCLLGKLGVTANDLPDALHYDAFEDGVSPSEWADELISNEGLDPDLL